MAQSIELMGATYPDVPAVQLPRTGGGTAKFTDVSGTTATAADVASGKAFFLADGTQATGTASGGLQATWFGAVEPEFLYEYRASYNLTDAYNWPITPTTAAQNLTWATDYTTTANANAVFDRYGNGYHGGTALDYGQYSYVYLCSGFVLPAYSVAESTLGKAHVIGSAFEAVMHYAARPRTASGNIVYPTTTTYGSYGNTNTSTLMCYYRTASGVLTLANNATYGVGLAAIAPQQASTSSVKPAYVNFRNPTISIRASSSYMPVDAYDYVDWDNTVVEYRARLYRVPVGYGLYNMQNDRMVRDMILGGTFPTEPI